MPDLSLSDVPIDSTARPIADGLFTWPDDPRLIGASCPNCGTTTFPRQGSCPRCMGTEMREVTLATTGRLWTWTIQSFEPKSPYAGEGPFTPYGVGYVELTADEEGAAAVLVESPLSASTADELRIGADMTLEIVPFRHDEDGNQLVTFFFRPASGPAD